MPAVWAIWSDLFHEAVPDEFIDAAFRNMHIAGIKGHVFLLLTKRPERMAKYVLGLDNFTHSEVFDNIWYGTTIENQEQADKRIPYLLTVPGKKFLSIEPLLGPVALGQYYLSLKTRDKHYPFPYLADEHRTKYIDLINAVICGGESGPHARPMNAEWASSLRDQCAAASVPFLFKQWDGKTKTRALDGRVHNNMPWRMPSL
ncbi:MAG: phage Gp37/Gp68 family protein [Syntrophales bacterium LBB04]|nr:phage Gp37/Gp68 family protein [Syntrophales bacterium LBB04]